MFLLIVCHMYVQTTIDLGETLGVLHQSLGTVLIWVATIWLFSNYYFYHDYNLHFLISFTHSWC